MHTYLTTNEVLKQMRITNPTLRAKMNATPKDGVRPWRNIGTKRHPNYRWRADLMDDWLSAMVPPDDGE